jgi:hypothetical protein
MVQEDKEKTEKNNFFKRALSPIIHLLKWIDSGQQRKPVCKT